MTATFSPARRRCARSCSSAAWRCWCWRWRGRKCRGAPSSPRAAGSISWSRSTSRSRCWRATSIRRGSIAPRQSCRASSIRLKGDRVGLVAFAGETMSYPLTVDYEAAKLFWRDLGPDDMPVGGTDLGRALDGRHDELLARARARRQEAPGAGHPPHHRRRGHRRARHAGGAEGGGALGIKIFTLGIGSNDKPPVPLFDEDGKQHGYLTDDAGEPMRVGLDATSLKQIGGGHRRRVRGARSAPLRRRSRAVGDREPRAHRRGGALRARAG